MIATAKGGTRHARRSEPSSISAASNFGSCCEPHASGSLLKTSRHPLPTRFSQRPYEPGKPGPRLWVAINVLPNRSGASIFKRGTGSCGQEDHRPSGRRRQSSEVRTVGRKALVGWGHPASAGDRSPAGACVERRR